MNRPADETNRASVWLSESMERLGQRYGEAYAGDLDAFRDVLVIATRAAEAVERLRLRDPQAAAHLAAAAPAWPVLMRTGTAEAECLRSVVEELGVGRVRSDNRAERSEWPNAALGVNKAAKEVRRIVRVLWNEGGEVARRLGPLSKANAREWFAEGWGRYLEDCEGNLGHDSALARVFCVMVREIVKQTATGAADTDVNKSVKKSLEAVGREEEIAAGRRETERQAEEKRRAKREEKARRSATKRLRGEVQRSFERWQVVEVVT